MKKNVLSLKVIVAIFLINVMAGVTVYAQTPSPTLNGLPTLKSATASSVGINAVFGYSDSDLNNVFIINGVEVPLLNSGWFDNTGEHSVTNQNYVCGDADGVIYNNFFAVDLSNLSNYGITTPITSAVLHINRYSSEPVTGTFNFTLSNVTNSYTTLNQSYNSSDATGIAIYEDLGDGTTYASAMLDQSVTSGTYEDIPLNSAGLAAMNASVGSTFVVGGTGNPSAVLVPVSYWAIALFFLVVGMSVVIRLRKRQLTA